jgi:hypothetical protein
MILVRGCTMCYYVYMNFAITTRFAGPTDSSGSRIIASYDGKHRTTSYDHRLSAEHNHNEAAASAALFFGLGEGQLYSAEYKPNIRVHVLVRYK